MTEHVCEWHPKIGWGEDDVCCLLEGCAAEMTCKEMSRRLNEYEILKKGPSIKISDGDVWLVFPDAMISLDSILFSKPGTIVERNLRKWRDNILEGKDG